MVQKEKKRAVVHKLRGASPPSRNAGEIPTLTAHPPTGVLRHRRVARGLEGQRLRTTTTTTTTTTSFVRCSSSHGGPAHNCIRPALFHARGCVPVRTVGPLLVVVVVGTCCCCCCRCCRCCCRYIVSSFQFPSLHGKKARPVRGQRLERHRAGEMQHAVVGVTFQVEVGAEHFFFFPFAGDWLYLYL